MMGTEITSKDEMWKKDYSLISNQSKKPNNNMSHKNHVINEINRCGCVDVDFVTHFLNHRFHFVGGVAEVEFAARHQSGRRREPADGRLNILTLVRRVVGLGDHVPPMHGRYTTTAHWCGFVFGGSLRFDWKI